MGIGSNVVTSFQPQLHSYSRRAGSSWQPGSHWSADGILAAKRRMSYLAPGLSEQRTQLKRLKGLFDLNGGALSPFSVMSAVLQLK